MYTYFNMSKKNTLPNCMWLLIYRKWVSCTLSICPWGIIRHFNNRKNLPDQVFPAISANGVTVSCQLHCVISIRRQFVSNVIYSSTNICINGQLKQIKKPREMSSTCMLWKTKHCTRYRQQTCPLSLNV